MIILVPKLLMCKHKQVLQWGALCFIEPFKMYRCCDSLSYFCFAYQLFDHLTSAVQAVDCLFVCVYCRNGDCQAVASHCRYALGAVLEWTKGKRTRYVVCLTQHGILISCELGINMHRYAHPLHAKFFPEVQQLPTKLPCICYVCTSTVSGIVFHPTPL